MSRDFPDDYPPLNYCRACGRDFTSVTNFDRHRIGVHEYDWSPEREDGRRCMDRNEMLAVGLRAMTDDGMATDRRHRRRVGCGVEMWFDPELVEAARSHFSALPEPVEATEGIEEAA